MNASSTLVVATESCPLLYRREIRVRPSRYVTLSGWSICRSGFLQKKRESPWWRNWGSSCSPNVPNWFYALHRGVTIMSQSCHVHVTIVSRSCRARVTSLREPPVARALRRLTCKVYQIMLRPVKYKSTCIIFIKIILTHPSFSILRIA